MGVTMKQDITIGAKYGTGLHEGRNAWSTISRWMPIKKHEFTMCAKLGAELHNG